MFVSNFAFLLMISMQRLLLKLLRIVRFVRDYIVGRAGSWNSFIALLGRRIRELRRSRNRKPGTSRKPRAADQTLHKARSYPASGGSAVLREYEAAASTVPGPLAALSASLASFQDDAGQSASVPPSLPPSPTSSPSISPSLSVHQPHTPYGSSRSASSSGNLSGWSAQSRASERLSRIVDPREQSHISGQLSRLPRGIYRQFGPSVQPIGQLPRSSVHTHPYDADEGRSPVVPHSPSSSTHGSVALWPRSGSATSINLSIQNPSTDTLAMAVDYPHTAISFTVDHSETASSVPSFSLPEGRFIQMIQSDQIPRYDKNVTM